MTHNAKQALYLASSLQKCGPHQVNSDNERKKSIEMLRNFDFSRQVLRTNEDVVFVVKSVARFRHDLFKV